MTRCRFQQYFPTTGTRKFLNWLHIRKNFIEIFQRATNFTHHSVSAGWSGTCSLNKWYRMQIDCLWFSILISPDSFICMLQSFMATSCVKINERFCNFCWMTLWQNNAAFLIFVHKETSQIFCSFYLMKYFFTK